MTALRDVSGEFILWTISGEDVGREMQAALQRVQSHHNSHAERLRGIRCIHVNGPELPKGPVHAVFATIEYGTWARGRHQSPSGPSVVRDAVYPWGLPHLQGTARQIIEQENQRLREVLRLLHRVNSDHPETKLFFAFPEFLGTASRGCPASPWRLRELRRWASKEGWCRYALYQCELHEESHRFPLGLLTSEPFNSRCCRRGWPRIRGHDGKYIGPLPATCDCNHAHQISTPSASHRDPPLAAIRPGFMEWLWRKLLKVGPLRTGRPDADQRDPLSSSGGETWIDSQSSSSSTTSRSTAGSPPPSTTTITRRLNEDQDLAINLGLGEDDRIKDAVLNAMDTNDQNYEYKAPTVKARAER